MQMGIALGCGAVIVSEQRPNDWQARAARYRNAGEAVAKIMQADIIQTRHTSNDTPNFRRAFIIPFTAMSRKHKGRSFKSW